MEEEALVAGERERERERPTQVWPTDQEEEEKAESWTSQESPSTGVWNLWGRSRWNKQGSKRVSRLTRGRKPNQFMAGQSYQIMLFETQKKHLRFPYIFKGTFWRNSSTTARLKGGNSYQVTFFLLLLLPQDVKTRIARWSYFLANFIGYMSGKFWELQATKICWLKCINSLFF